MHMLDCSLVSPFDRNDRAAISTTNRHPSLIRRPLVTRVLVFMLFR